VATFERQLATHPSRWGSLALARCRAIAEPGPTSLALFSEAVQMFEWGEQPYEFGRTMAAFAERQEFLGMENEARHSRLTAVTAFEAGGAEAWARRTRQREHDARPQEDLSLLERLAPDEREVVHGLLQGLRSREIATSLHVSIRTVELRLTRIYRTLGVRSRGELSALFRGHTPNEGEST
jgi:DNA-binding CsgD family transcriptional regulator